MKFRNCAAAAALMALNSFVQAELFDRGNGTVYDSTQDITWLKDWNVNGGQNLATQAAWADNLSVAGATAWALPSNSQYSRLFAEFGDLTNPSLPFTNVQLYLPYWTSTEWEFGGDQGWRFFANDGDLNGINTSARYGAVAVHDGDVGVITIDIKPGSDPNSINLESKGVIPVAILMTDTFDATQVDWDTVSFGPDGATESHGRSHVNDVDGDGDMDVVLHFKTQETGIGCDDTEATLTGETFGGEVIQGSDSFTVEGCR